MVEGDRKKKKSRNRVQVQAKYSEKLTERVEKQILTLARGTKWLDIGECLGVSPELIRWGGWGILHYQRGTSSSKVFRLKKNTFTSVSSRLVSSPRPEELLLPTLPSSFLSSSSLSLSLSLPPPSSSLAPLPRSTDSKTNCLKKIWKNTLRV